MVFQTGQTSLLQWRLGRTFRGKHGTSFLLLGPLQPQQPHHYKENTVFISLNRSCSSLSRVKEVGGAVVANFPGNWEDWLHCRVCVSWNSNCVLIRTSAQLFSASRGYAVFCLEWRKLLRQMLLIFLVNWENRLPAQICVFWNCKFVLTRKSAEYLFSFKRIYSILSCMKQAVGGDVANFLVNWEDWLPGQIRVF